MGGTECAIIKNNVFSESKWGCPVEEGTHSRCEVQKGKSEREVGFDIEEFSSASTQNSQQQNMLNCEAATASPS